MHVSSNHHLQQSVTICFYTRTDFSLIIPKMAAADTSGHTLSGSFNNAPFIIAHNGQCKSYYRIRTVAVASKGKIMEWRVRCPGWSGRSGSVAFQLQTYHFPKKAVVDYRRYNNHHYDVCHARHEPTDGFFGFRKIK